MKNVVWHVVLPSQTSNVMFHWKILFFVALKETLWFCHHLDENQCQVNVQISVSVVCHLDSHEQTNLTCFWALTNLQSAVLKKIMFCAVASAVTLHFLHCSCWTQHLFGVCFHLVSVIKFFSFIQVKNVMCWFGPKMNDMLVHWKKKHVLCDSVSSDSALLASPWETAVSCKFVFTCSHWTLFFN